MIRPTKPGRQFFRIRSLPCRRMLAHVPILLLGLCPGPAAAAAMRSAPDGELETGAPSFVVLGPEAMGLGANPVDFKILPDGRILVISREDLSFGDGVRWEAFHAADDRTTIFSSVAVDLDGRIYTGVGDGFARIDLQAPARWRLNTVVDLPEEAATQRAALISVANLGDDWYWYGGNGAIVSWRPGREPQTVGNLSGIDRIFTLDGTDFVSDDASGALYRLRENGPIEPVQTASVLVSEGVTCATPFAPGLLLAGTGSAGLKLFDGTRFKPFGQPGLPGKGFRITDVCPVGDDYFAASIDTFGIIFFDREGRLVQVLERKLDHRLARVKRVQYSQSGVLWALLNDGIARVQFPSPVSHFEPLLPSGLKYAQPLRHKGRLWVLADGRAMRGVYTAGGRLEQFVDDTPQGEYLFTLTDIDGRLFGATDGGIHVREESGWRLILPGIVNARAGIARTTDGSIAYVARGEYGVIRHSGSEYTATRFPVPGLGDNYGAVIDAEGIGWIELGTSGVGRFDPADGNPVFNRIAFSEKTGVSGWVEIYVLDGIARFHVSGHLFRATEDGRSFVEDVDLLAAMPQLANATGRPVTDGSGRLWMTVDRVQQVVDRTAGRNKPLKITPVGFAPTSYTVEENGVVWMFERGHLARTDLRMPSPPETPLRAQITSVQFAATGRRVFAPGATLEPIDYSDNSLVINFAAPANPFAAPVTFEVLLEGAGNQWVSTGAAGTAVFNRLKEDNYVFRVRPVRGGSVGGAEASLAFTITPPWYRTPVAWLVYGASALGLLAFVVWLSSFLQKRENERLERLVAHRTSELRTSNEQLGRQIDETTEKSAALAASEERYRELNAGLEDRVRQRAAELEALHKQLLVTTRKAGMAEVATGVLHNVGNVLNSVNVSATLVRDTLKTSEVASLERVAGLLRDKNGDIGTFIASDPKGRLLPRFIIQLSEQISREHSVIRAENEHLSKNIEHIKGIVSMQQSYASVSGVREEVSLADLLRDALHMHAGGLQRHHVKVVHNFEEVPPVLVDKHRVLQILVNLIQNAKHAVTEANRPDGCIVVKLAKGEGDLVRISVSDNGVGIPAENLVRIFSHGFTTRANGHGFGLHSGALAAKEMGGTLSVESAGPGLGATFTLELPLLPSKPLA